MAFNSSWLKGVKAQDLESAAPAESPSTAASVMGKVGSFFGRGNSQELPMTVESSTTSSSSSSDFLGMSRTERFKAFVVLILVSALFFAMSFMFFPMVVILPSKFALSFTMGSILFMTAFAILRGPKEHCKTLCTRSRIPFTVAYIGSLLGTLYACLGLSSSFRYFIIIGCAALQIVSLLWFGATYIPGGKIGMHFFSKMFVKTAKMMFSPCIKACRHSMTG